MNLFFLATTTTTTTTEFIPNADVIYPKDMERECLQPITIATILVMTAGIPLHLFGMINLFTRMNSNFQKETLKKRDNRRIIFKKIREQDEEEESFV